MRRRFVLAALGVTGIAGCLDGGSAESDGDDEADESSSDDPASLPIDIRTVEAPGSDDGTVTISQGEQVMCLNFTRLQCPTSEGLIGTIGDVRDELGSRYDVDPEGELRFVSIVDPRRGPDPSDDELAAWWEEHGGQWTVGIDEEGALDEYYEIRGLPTVVAIDGEGEVHWQDRGDISSRRIRRGIERAIEAEGAVDEANSSNESDDDA
jgi:hypothetical protein